MYAPRTAAGMLMTEHRLILRVIDDIRQETERIRAGGDIDPDFIGAAVAFLRNYADRCHHGKEEDILFRDLGEKQLSLTDGAAMRGLIDDHVRAREMTRALVAATAAFSAGDIAARADVKNLMGELAAFYPVHIEKEDHGFFKVAFDYFTPVDREAMAEEFREFDQSLVHETYRLVAEELEQRAERSRALA